MIIFILISNIYSINKHVVLNLNSLSMLLIQFFYLSNSNVHIGIIFYINNNHVHYLAMYRRSLLTSSLL